MYYIKLSIRELNRKEKRSIKKIFFLRFHHEIDSFLDCRIQKNIIKLNK